MSDTLTPKEAFHTLTDLFGSHVKVISSTDDGLIHASSGVLQNSIQATDPRAGLVMEMFSIVCPHGIASPTTFGFSLDTIQHAFVEKETLVIESGCGLLHITAIED